MASGIGVNACTKKPYIPCLSTENGQNSKNLNLDHCKHLIILTEYELTTYLGGF